MTPIDVVVPVAVVAIVLAVHVARLDRLRDRVRRLESRLRTAERAIATQALRHPMPIIVPARSVPWPDGAEQVTHVRLWSAAEGGSVVESVPLCLARHPTYGADSLCQFPPHAAMTRHSWGTHTSSGP